MAGPRAKKPAGSFLHKAQLSSAGPGITQSKGSFGVLGVTPAGKNFVHVAIFSDTNSLISHVVFVFSLRFKLGVPDLLTYPPPQTQSKGSFGVLGVTPGDQNGDQNGLADAASQLAEAYERPNFVAPLRRRDVNFTAVSFVGQNKLKDVNFTAVSFVGQNKLKDDNFTAVSFVGQSKLKDVNFTAVSFMGQNKLKCYSSAACEFQDPAGCTEQAARSVRSSMSSSSSSSDSSAVFTSGRTDQAYSSTLASSERLYSQFMRGGGIAFGLPITGILFLVGFVVVLAILAFRDSVNAGVTLPKAANSLPA
eukprot:gene32674-17687_t